MRRSISMIFLVLVATYASWCRAYAVESPNLLRNPSFEEVGAWRTYTADTNDVADPRSLIQAHNGTHSAYTKATTIGGDGYALISQDVSIPINPNLEFSFWLYVRRHELPLHGYIKGFVTSSGGRFLDVGIWSGDAPEPKANEYRLQVPVEKYDAWFRIGVNLGKLWIDEAKFPRNDTITTISLGIYNGLVYALPENLLQLEVFFDDVFLGSSAAEEKPSFLWITVAVIGLISATVVVAAIVRTRLRSMKRRVSVTHVRGTLGGIL